MKVKNQLQAIELDTLPTMYCTESDTDISHIEYCDIERAINNASLGGQGLNVSDNDYHDISDVSDRDDYEHVLTQVRNSWKNLTDEDKLRYKNNLSNYIDDLIRVSYDDNDNVSNIGDNINAGVDTQKDGVKNDGIGVLSLDDGVVSDDSIK